MPVYPGALYVPYTFLSDDERELRNYLKSMLKEAWPELDICGEAANGDEALELVSLKRPQIAFLDIRMPGLSGMDVAEKKCPHLQDCLCHRL